MKSEPDLVFVLRSTPDLRLHILCNRPSDCLWHPKMQSMHFGELTASVLRFSPPPTKKGKCTLKYTSLFYVGSGGQVLIDGLHRGAMKSEPDLVFVLRSTPDLRLHILCNRPSDCLWHPKMQSMHFGELTASVLRFSPPPTKKGKCTLKYTSLFYVGSGGQI